MSDDPAASTVPVVCPECETTTRVPLPEVADTVARHNDGQHEGRDVAHVDPAIVDRITDLAAADLGLTDDSE
jgi:hypothetical protein